MRSAACVVNIGAGQRRRRLGVGVVGVLVGAAATAALVVLGVPRIYRLALVVPFWVGALGVLQHREKT